MSFIHIIFTLAEDEFDWHFYVNTNLVSKLKIRKGGWVDNPPNRYRVRVDKPEPSQGKKHIHIYKNDEFVVITKDGERRHGGDDSITVPKKLYKWIKENFPDFNLPKDRVINYGSVILPANNPLIIFDVDQNTVWVDNDLEI